jgi:hypothetical protein
MGAEPCKNLGSTLSKEEYKHFAKAATQGIASSIEAKISRANQRVVNAAYFRLFPPISAYFRLFPPD